MRYSDCVFARFLSRPNRFTAEVEYAGRRETVHVKNTGRCRELLLPGAEVSLCPGTAPGRKTAFDLIAVRSPQLGWVNLDSQAPNRVVREWLPSQGFANIRPETPFGRSRLDFSMEKDGEPWLLEVKGCTLAIDGVGYFPDAPTLRGVRHLQELTEARRQGYRCAVAFVIQMETVREVRPNIAAHPEFGEALAQAQAAGVEVWPLCCRVDADLLEIRP